MNPSLKALMTKLTWQKNELSIQLKAIEEETSSLRQMLVEVEQTLSEASNSSLIINPEFEINRLNFITHHHEHKEQIEQSLKNQAHKELHVKDKIKRVSTELKVLEQYIEREALKAHQVVQKKAEQAMDEWVIQKRESA